MFFAAIIAAVFFAGSLAALTYGHRLGLRYLEKDAGKMSGLTTVEGAVFALIGLLLAFTISGALQRFDDRRQLVIQEANASTTAHDRVALFERDVAVDLQTKLRAYVEARIELYRLPHDYSLWERTEFFSPDQQDKILVKKTSYGTRRLQHAHRPAFDRRALRFCRRSQTCLKLLDCVSAQAKNTHHRLSTLCSSPSG